MNEQDALLETIFDRPADDAPRLIYSDWLEEHDLPGYAAFIREQVHLSHFDFFPDDAPPKCRSWDAYRTEIAPNPAWAHIVQESVFERGFPSYVGVTVPVLRDYSREWWPSFPVTGVAYRMTPLCIAEFLRVPYLTRLRELHLAGHDPHGLMIPHLARCRTLNNIRRLDLHACLIGVEAVEALATSEVFTQLTDLRLPAAMRPNGGAAKMLREKFGDICLF